MYPKTFYHHLSKNAQMNIAMLNKVDCYCKPLANETPENVIRRSVQMHLNVAMLDESDLVKIKISKNQRSTKKSLPEDLMNEAATCLIFSSYKNQLLHIFVRVALLSLSVNICEADTMPLGMWTI